LFITLGKKYKWINPIAVIWVALCVIIFCLPFSPEGVPGETGFSWSSVNYAPIVTILTILAVTIWYATSAKKTFKGPIRTIDELDAEGVARPGVGGDGAGDVLVPGASHADVDLGEQAQLGAAGAQSSGQFDRSAPALDVPRRHPHPARQGFGGAGGPLVDLVEARQVLQQPAMEVFVAEPAGPALTVGPRRYVHPLSLSPGGPGASGAVTALP